MSSKLEFTELYFIVTHSGYYIACVYSVDLFDLISGEIGTSQGVVEFRV